MYNVAKDLFGNECTSFLLKEASRQCLMRIELPEHHLFGASTATHNNELLVQILLLNERVNFSLLYQITGSAGSLLLRSMRLDKHCHALNCTPPSNSITMSVLFKFDSVASLQLPEKVQGGGDLGFI